MIIKKLESDHVSRKAIRLGATRLRRDVMVEQDWDVGF